jgi:hypothetical protein
MHRAAFDCIWRPQLNCLLGDVRQAHNIQFAKYTTGVSDSGHGDTLK